MWIDRTAPQVRSTVPADGATGVAPGVVLQATFSEAMNPVTINGPMLTRPRFEIFRSGTSTPLPATVTYDRETNKATLVPEAPLRPGVKYRAWVTQGAFDLVNFPLDQDRSAAGNQPKIWWFTVRR